MRLYLLAALRRAAQRALIASESLLRPSGVMPPPLFLAEPDDFDAPLAVPPPLPALAHRARAAAASFARVAADIGRRRPSCLAPDEPPPWLLRAGPPLLLPPPVKSELSRSSRD